MKVLAEYVMAGPKQASIFCLGFGFVPVVGPWLSVAALALVVLQLGLSSSLKVLPWAVLPGIVWLALGDPSVVLLLLSVFLSAIALERSRSLGFALLVSVCVSALTFLAFQSFVNTQAEQLSEVVGKALAANPDMQKLISADESFPMLNETKVDAKLEKLETKKSLVSTKELNVTENVEASSLTTGKMTSAEFETMVTMITKMAIAFASGFIACLVLLLARWWQSIIFKPGAFKTEFHALRLSRNHILALLLAIVFLVPGLGSLLNSDWSSLLVPLLLIPVLFSGIALIHGLAGIAGLSSHWLGFFYMALLFLGHLVVLPLAVAALVDAAVDFRTRFRRSKETTEND